MQSGSLGFATTAVLLALGLSHCAVVEEPREGLPPEERQDDERPPSRLPAFRALDTDSDGTLSAEEIEAAAESLASLDGDGDGRLSSGELSIDEPQRRPRITFGSPADLPEGSRVITLDAEGDGAVDIADLPPRARSVLSSADADGDGAASAAEVLAFMAAQGGASAEQGNAEDGESPPASVPPLMAALDADGDGALSEAEIESAARVLRMLDGDGDGRIAPAELQPDPAGGDPPE